MVQIDMEMPKGCRVCQFCEYDDINHRYECKLSGWDVCYSYKKRDNNCPLREVK